MRRPAPATLLAAAALAVAVAGTPVGQAATRPVARALFADNAGKVNGIKAARTPAAGRLVALDANARLPVAALPSGVPRTAWALVAGDGSLTRGSAGVSSQKLALGTYRVTFPRNVESCALLTTIAGGFGISRPNGVSGGAVDVETMDHGLIAGPEVVWQSLDEGFMVAAIC